MKKILPLFLFASFGLTGIAQTELLSDNSIEATTTWSSTSTNFGSVFCTDATCGTCGGGCGPHTGLQYAWFGGAGGALEEGTLTQTFNVASSGTAVLSFYLKMPIVPTILGDSLIVSIDGTNVFVATPADSNTYKAAYTQVVLPLGNMTAGSHTINFYGQETEGATFNNLVDDVSILIGSVNVDELFLDEYISMSQNMVNNEIIVATSFPESVDFSIFIYDQAGKQVYSNAISNASNNTVSISTANFSAGAYVIDFNKNDSNPFTRTFTVVK